MSSVHATEPAMSRAIKWDAWHWLLIKKNPEHWKYENNLAYKILNWKKLIKTWKYMEILSQTGFFVISKTSKIFDNYLPENTSSYRCTILLELIIIQMKAKTALRYAGNIKKF